MKAFIAFAAIVAAVYAEAEAEADPAYLYAASPYGYYGYAGVPAYYHAPYTFGKSAPCVNAANQPVPCAGFNGYVKRSADSEAEAEADPAYLYAASPYGYYGYAGVPAYYHAPYTFGKSAPCVNAANQPVPCAGFNGYVKRSADSEAEADPAYFAVPSAYGYAATPYGLAPYTYGHSLVHTSHFGVCTNYVGARVPC